MVTTTSKFEGAGHRSDFLLPGQVQPRREERQRNLTSDCDDCKSETMLSHDVAVEVPPGAPSWITADLVADTIRVWQPYYSLPLTPEDALGIIMNVGRLFDVLLTGRDA